MRWNVEISANDIDVFRRTCLDPILEQLCNWWEHIRWAKDDPFKSDTGLHFRFPYGCYNPTLEGNVADLDSYLETGSKVGLRQVENLFPELT